MPHCRLAVAVVCCVCAGVGATAPALKATRTTGGETSEDGASEVIYEVMLATAPTGAVEVPVMVSDAVEAELVVPDRLTFDAATWNVPQEVLVVGVDDPVDDGDQMYVVQFGPTASADPAYDAITEIDMLVNVDDDTAGALLSPAAPGMFTTSEEGGAVFVKVKFTSQPLADVSVMFRVNNTAEGLVMPVPLVVPAADWQLLHTVTIVGVDDPVDDGDVAFEVEGYNTQSADANYAGLQLGTYVVVNTDNDAAGITVNATDLRTGEDGAMAAFSLRLDSTPTSTVVVQVKASDESEVLLRYSTNAPAATAQILITPSTAGEAAVVYVIGQDDNVPDGAVMGTVSFEVMSMDTTYDGYPLTSIPFINDDDDVPGISLCGGPTPPCQPLAMSKVDETGRTVTGYLRMATEPAALVTLRVGTANPPQDENEVRVSPEMLFFDPTNWNEVRSVVVTGLSDGVDDGDQVVNIDLVVSTADPDYTTAVIPTWIITNTNIERDECRTASCSYTCVDPNLSMTSLYDWTCGCTAPAMGITVVAADTDCVHDECLDNAPTCNASLQDCVDPNTTVAAVGDWVCRCRPPAMGADALVAAAACMFDECTAAGVCAVAGQGCVDANADAVSRNDFTCTCTVGAGSAVGGAAECVLDECAAAPCGDLQACVDPIPLADSQGDFWCNCSAPYTGHLRGGPAACMHDECKLLNNSNLCLVQLFQLCADPAPSPYSVGDWVCQCVYPGVGMDVVAGPTVCVHDECLDKSIDAICGAAVGPGGLGHGYLQVCSDPNTDALSTGDWECTCVAPAFGAAIRTAALCTLDECDVEANLDTCEGQNQTCVDPNTDPLDPRSARDWECRCPPPQMGEPGITRASRSCVLDECTIHALTCNLKAQDCRDPSFTTVADWLCECRDPQTGMAAGAPAVCLLDECLAGDGVMCAAAGQLCNDTDHLATSRNSWECHCVPPATGIAITQLAECIYDECAVPELTCGANQTCIDPDIRFVTLKDYTCECIYPLVGETGRGTAALCELDECNIHASICIAANQECFDTAARAYGDWGCRCKTPFTGENLRAPATCYYDECLEKAEACAAVGQSCEDTEPATLDTWQCVCVAPLVGVPSASSPALCVLDECADPFNAIVCENVGQRCDEPDARVLQDWTCNCLPPAAPATAVGAPAECITDVCAQANNTCAQQNQDCTPLNDDGSEFRCSCRYPSAGEADNAPAACMDGCAQAGDAVCAAAAQLCEATNSTLLELSWRCVCQLPAVAAAEPPFGQVAECRYDECMNNTRCADEGQRCVDTNTDPLSLEDWRCECPLHADTLGEYDMKKPAECALDECVVPDVAAVCPPDQECVDPTRGVTERGDWECRCLPPHAAKAVARAVVGCGFRGECVAPEVHEVCLAWKQNCVDETRAVGDWRCVCEAPLRGEAVAGPATCEDPAQNTTGAAGGSNAGGGTTPSWWAILIILLLVLVLCVVCGYIFSRRRAQQERVDTYMYEVPRDTGEDDAHGQATPLPAYANNGHTPTQPPPHGAFAGAPAGGGGESPIEMPLVRHASAVLSRSDSAAALPPPPVRPLTPKDGLGVVPKDVSPEPLMNYAANPANSDAQQQQHRRRSGDHGGGGTVDVDEVLARRSSVAGSEGDALVRQRSLQPIPRRGSAAAFSRTDSLRRIGSVDEKRLPLDRLGISRPERRSTQDRVVI